MKVSIKALDAGKILINISTSAQIYRTDRNKRTVCIGTKERSTTSIGIFFAFVTKTAKKL